MKKINKYLYLFVLQGDYGLGWEDLTQSESHKEMRQNRRDYVNNDNQVLGLRIIQRRELNPDYISQAVNQILGK